MKSRGWLTAAAMVLCMAFEDRPASAQTADLTALSLEDLLNTEITSVSRKKQPLSRTAAAVYVITDEDIRRSGARTLPDLLRTVPGFNVAQIDAATWAVTARGFNSLYANKLLVLVDGRSVYTPLFAGVNWDMQTLPLGDIKRIEVVRGPGGSLWGTNAVNGVVNIITKAADETQGAQAKAAFGGARGGVGDVRYGGRIGNGARYRVYGKYAASGTNRPVRGFTDPDDESVRLGGVRIDWGHEIDRVSVQGSVQNGRSNHVRAQVLLSVPWSTFNEFRTTFAEGNVALRWTRSPSSRRETQVQASYSAYSRDAQYGQSPSRFIEDWQIVEIEGRQRRGLGRRHELVGGVGYRFWATAIGNTPEIAFLPANDQHHVGTAFVQDEMALGRSVYFTSGLKLERNEFTGFEAQPSLRVVWSLGRAHALWAAASRSLRTPSIADRGVRIPAFAAPGPGGVPMVGMIEGSPAIESETLYAYEAGYRVQLGRVFVDMTGFTNQYSKLVSARALAPTLGVVASRAVAVLPQKMTNLQGGHAHGAEAVATWHLAAWWRVSGSWSMFKFDPHTNAEVTAVDGAAFVRTPERQFNVRSYLDLPGKGEVTVFVARVGTVGPSVPAYTSVNLRTAWPIGPAVDLAFGVENLLHNNAIEFEDRTGFESSPVRTAVFGDVSWRF